MGAGYISDILGTDINLYTALVIHCSTNCYPPIHRDFIPFFQEAIDDVVFENPYRKIALPNGKVMTSGEIVRKAHLEEFVDYVYRVNFDEVCREGE